VQREIFGIDAIGSLIEILKEYDVKKVFIVHGKNSYRASGAEKEIEDILKNFEVRRFFEKEEIPSYEVILKGISAVKDWSYDVVIAVGGGGVMDVAKCINILNANEGNAEDFIRGKNTISKKGKPLIAIPTTSGSGSEATHFAVTYIFKEKYSLAHKYILPDISIVDPQFTFNLSRDVTASSGIDALAQAIESYWSVNSNAESLKLANESIKLILENLEGAVNNPSEENRINMSRAAHLAGKAINITKTTAPHALSYSMTSHFNISHGQAVAISLGEFLIYNSEVSKSDIQGSRSIEETKENFGNLIKILGCRDAEEAGDKISRLMKSIGLKTRLHELGIEGEEKLNLIADKINLERLRNNPRKLTKENLKQIIRTIS